VRWRSAALVLGALAIAGIARADEAPQLRSQVIAALDAQLEVVARTRATVQGKLDDTAGQRGRRARAAYRLLRTGEPTWIAGDERMATARRRAAARWLLARDQHEEALLADELAALTAAEARLTADRAAAEAAPLPSAGLDRPVRGAMTIARRFGPYVHDRSKATLTRRGLDLEVAEGAEVVPLADGIVTYAGPIRGLDHGLIVDHGGWLSVIAKLAPPSVAAGAKVTRGQTIGTPARRRVYLEIRVEVGPGGVPVDPERLLGASDR
jgi:septal ring factor EnvC (AmiA/AmiB activator)